MKDNKKTQLYLIVSHGMKGRYISDVIRASTHGKAVKIARCGSEHCYIEDTAHPDEIVAARDIVLYPDVAYHGIIDSL